MVMAVRGVPIRTSACRHCRPRLGVAAGRNPVAPAAISPKVAHRRPIRHGRERRLIESHEIARAINDPATHDRHVGCDVGDLAFRAREIVPVRYDQIRELADLDVTLLAFLV
jgi:hypothetical protein